jgi:hypothetical protein
VSRVDDLLELDYAARCRQIRQPAAAIISSTKDAGSGTAAFATVPDPLAAGWPTWVRYVLYSAGVPSIFRHAT